jgi:hypothetical protein
VVAGEQIDGSNIEWASTDGKTWTRLNGLELDTYLNGGAIVQGRDRGLVPSNNATNFDGTDFSYFNSRLTLITLKQTGAEPWPDSWQMVLGPSGVLVTVDGSRFWVGVPTAG